MTKILTIVGTRPQIIKYSSLARAASRTNSLNPGSIELCLLHTGQHYDPEMSGHFFKELGLPSPEIHLEAQASSPGVRMGRMILGIEEVIRSRRPHMVLTMGDTDSTLAGAIAAANAKVKLGHIEAGVRSGNRIMPEEMNRIATDHLSDFLFCPSQKAMQNCSEEGISEKCFLTGDILFDTLLHFLPHTEQVHGVLERFKIQAKSFLFLTIHRAENIGKPARIVRLIEELVGMDIPILFPMHPRTQTVLEQKLARILRSKETLTLAPPLPYLETILLAKKARALITDSGGLQREGYHLGTPVVLIREETEWPETLEERRVILAGLDPERVRKALHSLNDRTEEPLLSGNSVYGRGDGSEKIISKILEIFS